MKNLTIYNVYVEMQDQEQCDRMKHLCIENNLSYWDDKCAFTFIKDVINEFSCYLDNFSIPIKKEFYVEVNRYFVNEKTKVTEEQFINLLKQHKN